MLLIMIIFQLANYIKACSRNDRNLNQCATKNAQAAIPHMMNGKIFGKIFYKIFCTSKFLIFFPRDF